jgi:hypothetical protein
MAVAIIPTDIVEGSGTPVTVNESDSNSVLSKVFPELVSCPAAVKYKLVAPAVADKVCILSAWNSGIQR